jgi:SAM-dependent MidA family methyltransferase
LGSQSTACEPHATLSDLLRSRIAFSPRQAISFRDYMELCLYEETFGYYNQATPKVGKEGDFYTSAMVGTIMGELLAAYFIRLSERFVPAKPVAIVEWGGGTGRLAELIMNTIAAQAPELYERLEYRLVEISPHHRELQREALKNHRQVRQCDTEQWAEDGEERPLFVFSNELLDAFAVHRVERRNGVLHEWYVGWDETQAAFKEVKLPLQPDSPAAEYLNRQNISVREGQIVDLNPAAADWIRHVGGKMDEGALVTIDYGDVAEELYAEHRMRGTLLCYRNHQAYDAPFAFPGEQDMTTHVDFTACIQAGLEVGLDVWSLRTQKQFLIDEGALNLLAAHDGRDPFSPAARRNRAIRQLLLSDQMSELFKVLVQTKKGD